MFKTFHTFGVLAALLPVANAQQPAEKIAVTGARVVTVSGETLEKATILVQNGRITDIGSAVEVPWDAEVIDGAGKTVMPGLVIAQTSSGLDRGNENVSVTPFVSVLDAVNPVDMFFEESLREGHTSLLVIPGNSTVIGGTGRVLKPLGLTVEAMTIRPDGGMKISASPKRGSNSMAHMAELRRTFTEFDQKLANEAKKKVEEKAAESESAEGSTEGNADEIEPLEVLEWRDLGPKDRALFEVVSGRMRVFLWCERAMDVAHGLSIARENGFLAQTTLVIGTECWKAADEIKDAGVGVILPIDFVHRERDNLSGETIETSLAKVFHDKGVPFALSATGRGAQLQSSLLMRAAVAVSQGVPADAALKAITQTPAGMIGIGDTHGALEKGKSATLLVLNGDPMKSGTVIEHVLIGGQKVYSRSDDQRLQRLTGDSKDGGR